MELYNANEMPLSDDEELRSIQLKVLNNQSLSMAEKIKIGRDHPLKECSGYQFKPDHVYRAMNHKLFDIYKKMGKIVGIDAADEYMEWEENGKKYNNNKGVDWYLGGVCLRYGDLIIECPADKEYFQPAYDNGNGLSADPTIKFMKSSGFKKPVPLSMITRVFAIKVDHNNITMEDISEYMLNKDNIKRY